MRYVLLAIFIFSGLLVNCKTGKTTPIQLADQVKGTWIFVSGKSVFYNGSGPKLFEEPNGDDKVKISFDGVTMIITNSKGLTDQYLYWFFKSGNKTYLNGLNANNEVQFEVSRIGKATIVLVRQFEGDLGFFQKGVLKPATIQKVYLKYAKQNQ